MQKSEIFSEQLQKLVEEKRKKEVEEEGKKWKKLVDGDPVNQDPLTEIPESKMRVYGFSNFLQDVYFDTEEELMEWIVDKPIGYGSVCVLDYLGRVAGRDDVIRTTYLNGTSRMITPCDRDGYGIYNPQRSIYCGEFVWEYSHGDIKEEMAAFRDRGIVFVDDVYKKEEERLQKIRQYMHSRRG